MKLLTISPLIAAMAVCISSCDSPELKHKRDAQLLEISKLKGELALVEEQLKTIPADQSAELAKAEEEAGVQTEEIKKLEVQIADLEAKKRALEKEFNEYKGKYVIR